VIKVGVIAVVLAAASTPAILPSSTESLAVTRHEAKIRTFEALLRQTELPPDVSDATHADITVQGCIRKSYGFRCRGALHPVAFSGIDGSTCHYYVRIFPRTTHLVESTCE
jgi:hypothetical protein